MVVKHHTVSITGTGNLYPLPDGFKPVRAELTFEGDDFRFTLEPTQVPSIGSAVGHLAKDGGAVALIDDEIRFFRGESAGTTVIQLSLYDEKDDGRYD